MEKDQFLKEMRKVFEFVKSLPDEFMEDIVSLPSTSYNIRIHIQHDAFVEIFPDFKAIRLNGPYVNLESGLDGNVVICLYPIPGFIKKFGADRLPS
jgi:hypothetical protein